MSLTFEWLGMNDENNKISEMTNDELFNNLLSLIRALGYGILFDAWKPNVLRETLEEAHKRRFIRSPEYETTKVRLELLIIKYIEKDIDTLNIEIEPPEIKII